MIYSKLSRIYNIHQIGAYLLHISKIAGIASLSLSIASCGGGGGGGSVAATATITSISPVGMVASGTPRALSITGTNFASGMTISVTDSLGGAYSTGTVTVQTSNLITTNVTIPSAPTDKYVTVAVKSSNGSLLASTILGVASTNITLSGTIQGIFTSGSLCTQCHGTGGGLNLSLGTTSTAAALINTNSAGCASRLRVTPGDPRRSKSILIDKILVASTGIAACSGNGMPSVGTLTPQNITDIIDWVAGGAN